MNPKQQPITPLYDSEDYESFCEREKEKGLRRKFWPSLPEMWRKELEFRKELEGCLKVYVDLNVS